MSADDRAEIFHSTSEGLQATLQHQLAAHRNLNQRAVDVVKIDLLAASVVVSGGTLSGSSAVLPYLAASTVSFLYSLWASIRVFRPRHFSRGLGPAEIDRIRADVTDEMPPDVHYEQLTMTIRTAVSENSVECLREAHLFDSAAWASAAGVLFAACSAGAVLLRPPDGVALFSYVVVPVLCLWGKDQYAFDGKERP